MTTHSNGSQKISNAINSLMNETSWIALMLLLFDDPSIELHQDHQQEGNQTQSTIRHSTTYFNKTAYKSSRTSANTNKDDEKS
uniref:Uncharacterized protein n=1 Tax=Ascaris lumbricoides TaxID=6252 RepID=A0A0M3I4V1_ASCLU